MNLTPDITNLLHEHYHTMRKMLKSGFPRRGVQKSFEELVYSVIGKDSWRPTHITRSALSECVTGSTRNIQRAHGILSDRMDRMDRLDTTLRGIRDGRPISYPAGQNGQAGQTGHHFERHMRLETNLISRWTDWTPF